MESKHTPTPWISESCGIHYDEDSGKTLSCMRIAEPESVEYRGEICTSQSADHINGISHDENIANAEFIVKAVNNHDAMIEEIKGLKIYIEELQLELERK